MDSSTSQLVQLPYLNDIYGAIAQLGQKNRNILVYYGEPALTSRLSRALHNQLLEQGQLCAFVDGVGLKEHTESPLERGPLLLRSDLGGGIDFSCYDIAYWCFWVAQNPMQAIDSVEFAKKMSRADKISAFADLVGAGQALDFSGVLKQMKLADMSATAQALIPEMISDAAKLIEGAIPFGVFAAKLPWFFVGLKERRRIWWKERGNEDLRELKAERGRPFDVLPWIPLFLARDLKQHFRRTDLAAGQKTAIVLVDGYDHLADDKSQAGQCSWLEAMLSKAESSPYVLWVIMAERPLPWMEDAQQVAVVPMAGWENALLTSVDTVRDDWSDQKRKLFELMAIPRYWDEALLALLAQQFLSDEVEVEGLNEESLREKLAVLTESPYVLALGNGTWRWQREMREYLLASQPLVERQRVHNWLFEHYRALATNTTQEILGLKEALYHGLQSAQPGAAIDWFLAAVLPAIERRPHPAIPEIVRAAVAVPDVLLPAQVALAYTRLGQALAAVYDWREAERALETALQQWTALAENRLAPADRSESQEDQLAAAETWYALAEVYLEQENAFDSLKSAQMATRIWGELLGEASLLYAQALSRQGRAYFHQKRRPDARRLSAQAVEIAAVLPEVTPLQLGELKWTATNVCCHADSLDEAEKQCLELIQFSAQLPEAEEHFFSIRSVALLGDIYSHMGRHKWQQAFDCYQQTIDQSQGVWGSDNDYAIAAVEAQIRLCRELGQQDLADKLAAQRERAVQPDQYENAVEVAASKNRMGFALYKKGQYGKAEPLWLQALALSQRILGDDHPDVATSLNNLATLYESQGRYDEAEPLHLKALALRQRILGNDHPDMAQSLNNLALLYESQGRYDEAEPLFLHALALRQQILGNDHPDVASSLNNLTLLYQSQGRYDEAEPLFLHALALRQRILDDDHPDVAFSLNNLAKLYESQGRYDEAKPLHLQALALWRRILGDDHPNVASSLNNLAALYRNQGRYDKAEPLHLQALALRQRILGNDHPDVAQSLNNLAELYRSQGRYDEAEPLFLQALALSQRILGGDHPDVAQNLHSLAALYKSQGRYDEAEPLLLQALALWRRILGNDHPDVAQSLNNLAELYRNQGRYDEAEPLFLQALALRQRILGDDHPNVASSLNNLAALYRNQGRYDEAEPLFLQALALRQRILGDDHPDVAISFNNLAALYRSQGRYDEAEPLYLQALALSQRILGGDHPLTQTIAGNLKSLQERS
ncbi:MAG: tetratricopeptide repeat protein [Phormidesmis sp.]